MEQTGARRAKPSTKPAAKRATPAGRPTPAELERRKLRVLEVATGLFVEQGYAGTSFVEIAKAAGVGANLIYQHFGDKEQLFREVIFARRTNPMDDPPRYQPGDSLHEALLRMARYACDIALRPRTLGLMRLIIAESQRFPDMMRAVADKTMNHLLRDFAALLDDLVAAGLTDIGDTQQAARLYMDIVLGMVPLRAYANWDETPPSDAELALKVTVFIRGVLGKAL